MKPKSHCDEILNATLFIFFAHPTVFWTQKHGVFFSGCPQDRHPKNGNHSLQMLSPLPRELAPSQSMPCYSSCCDLPLCEGKPTLRWCETGQAHVSTTLPSMTSRMCREKSCSVVAKTSLHQLSRCFLHRHTRHTRLPTVHCRFVHYCAV
jgi:hypothetical protein